MTLPRGTRLQARLPAPGPMPHGSGISRASPDPHRRLAVAPLIADQRCYGESPVRVRRGSGWTMGIGTAMGNCLKPYLLKALHVSLSAAMALPDDDLRNPCHPTVQSTRRRLLAAVGLRRPEEPRGRMWQGQPQDNWLRHKQAEILLAQSRVVHIRVREHSELVELVG